MERYLTKDRIMSKFKTWFNENLKDSAKDISSHGADAGYPHITYYSDTTKLFNKYRKDIIEMLKETSESMGYLDTIELLKTFNRQDMLTGYFEELKHDDSSKCLLVWFACEELSHQLEG